VQETIEFLDLQRSPDEKLAVKRARTKSPPQEKHVFRGKKRVLAFSMMPLQTECKTLSDRRSVVSAGCDFAF